MKKNFTEEQIKLICEGLANGDTAREIANTIGAEHTMYFETYMSRIRKKEIWTTITDGYDFKETKKVKQVREICKLISQGYTNREICDKFENDDIKLYRLVRRIRAGECYRKISIEYGIVNSLNPEKESVKNRKERIHKICACLEKGMCAKDISIELDEKFTNSFSTLVSQIRARRIHREISKDYRFKRLRRLHDRDEIIKICKGLDNDLTAREIARTINVAYTEGFASYVSKIKHGKIKQNIAKDYNFYKEKIRA